MGSEQDNERLLKKTPKRSGARLAWLRGFDVWRIYINGKTATFFTLPSSDVQQAQKDSRNSRRITWKK